MKFKLIVNDLKYKKALNNRLIIKNGRIYTPFKLRTFKIKIINSNPLNIRLYTKNLPNNGILITRYLNFLNIVALINYLISFDITTNYFNI